MRLTEISGRSRGTPRIANGLLRRVSDFAQVIGNGVIDLGITEHSLKALNVDKHGLDEMDNRILIPSLINLKAALLVLPPLQPLLEKKWVHWKKCMNRF